MSINTLSDKTTRRNRQKIVKEVTNSYTGINLDGDFKLFLTAFGDSRSNYNLGVIKYNDYLLFMYNNFNSYDLIRSSFLFMIPYGSGTFDYYSNIGYGATTSSGSTYIKGNYIIYNWYEVSTPYRFEFDMVNRSWSSQLSGHDTTGTLFNATEQYNGYTATPSIVVTGAYTLSPQVTFSK